MMNGSSGLLCSCFRGLLVFMTVFKGRQILNAETTHSLPASTGGTEGQKAKNKDSQREQSSD